MHYLELCHGLVALKIKNIWDYFQERTRNACNINFWWLGNLRLPCKRRIDFKIQFLHPIFIWNESSWNKSIKNVKNFSICEGSISNSLKNHNSFGCIAIRCMYNSTYTPQLHVQFHVHSTTTCTTNRTHSLLQKSWCKNPSVNVRKRPANIYLFTVNNWNTRKRCEICSMLTIGTPERCHWRRFSVFMVNFKHISHLFLVFLLLTLE